MYIYFYFTRSFRLFADAKELRTFMLCKKCFQIASATARPDKVVGAHFFVPAYYMRLLENIYGEKTSAETIATVQRFGVQLGKIPVLVGNSKGSIAYRMRGPMSTEAMHLLEEGCLPEEVDQAAEKFEMPIDPLKGIDLAGDWERMLGSYWKNFSSSCLFPNCIQT